MNWFEVLLLILCCVTPILIFIISQTQIVSTIRESQRTLDVMRRSTGITLRGLAWAYCRSRLDVLYVRIYQFFIRNVVPDGQGNYVITYAIDNQVYRFKTRRPRGPGHILLVTSADDTIVTDQIIGWIGPESNWHGCSYTPSLLGYSKLTFEFSDCSRCEFGAHETMKIEK